MQQLLIDTVALNCSRVDRTCSLYVWRGTQVLFQCLATEIVYLEDPRAQFLNITSDATECHCPDPACGIQSILATVTDPATLICDRSAGTCDVQQPQLPIPIAVSCPLAAQCVQPSHIPPFLRTSTSASTPPTNTIMPPVPLPASDSTTSSQWENSGVGLAAAIGFGVCGALLLTYCVVQAVRRKARRRRYVNVIAPTNTPRRGVDFEFEDMTFSLLVRRRWWKSLFLWRPRQKVVLLKDVWGTVPAGSIMAIVGESGAGKTTLLDVLSGRKSSGTIQGHVTLGGKHVRLKDMRFFSQYLLQNQDDLPAFLTVTEALRFATNLSRPALTCRVEKQAEVDAMLQTLGLTKVRNSLLGGSFVRGVSGGERRRVGIGISLVKYPALLLLDEPTSGLDAVNAELVMQTLSDVARVHGTTILLSIHQPRQSLLQHIQQLLVLYKGRVAFSGSLRDSLPFVKRFKSSVRTWHEVPDMLLDILASAPEDVRETMLAAAAEQSSRAFTEHPLVISTGVPVGPPTTSSTAITTADLADHSPDLTPRTVFFPAPAYPSPSPSEFHSDVVVVGMLSAAAPQRGAPVASTDGDTAGTLTSASVRPAWWYQLHILFCRSARFFFRFSTFFILQALLTTLSGVIVGLAIRPLDNNFHSIQNRFGIFLFTFFFLAFASLSSIDSFMSDRLLFMRERAARMYRPAVYFINKVLWEFLLLRWVPLLLYAVPAYWISGLKPTAGAFFLFLLALLLVYSALVSLAYGISAFINHPANATFIVGLVLLLFLLFSGALSRSMAMLGWLAWIRYVSPFFYAFEILMTNELHEMTLIVNQSGLPQISVNAADFLGFQFGLLWSYVPRDIVCLIIISLGWLIVSFFGILVFWREKR